jgi:hypothetical protein
LASPPGALLSAWSLQDGCKGMHGATLTSFFMRSGRFDAVKLSCFFLSLEQRDFTRFCGADGVVDQPLLRNKQQK